MSERVNIGRFGDGAQFRISKTGKSVTSIDLEDFIMREDAWTFKPFSTGFHAFSGNGAQSFAIPPLTYEPFVVLKSSDNTTAWQYGYYATLSADRETLTLHNAQNVSRTITFYVLQT